MKKDKEIYCEKIMAFIKSQYCKGASTEEIASNFNISNKRVGHLMRPLVKRGKIVRYGRGMMVISFSYNEPGTPIYIDNSFYSLF